MYSCSFSAERGFKDWELKSDFYGRGKNKEA